MSHEIHETEKFAIILHYNGECGKFPVPYCETYANGKPVIKTFKTYKEAFDGMLKLYETKVGNSIGHSGNALIIDITPIKHPSNI